MKQHIFLRGEWIGARDIPTWDSLGPEPSLAHSYALFCPKCAEIWGKLMHDHPEAYCQVETQYCRDHATQPSDGTFTRQSRWDDPRSWGYGGEWPREALLNDIIALTTFYLNHPEKWYKS